MADNVSDELHDGILTHTVSLLRVAASERQKVLAMLEGLEAKLIADLNQTVGKTEATISRLQALLKQTQSTIAGAYKDIAANNGQALSKIAHLEATKTVNAVNTALKVGVATVGMSPEQLAAIAGKTLIAGKFPKEHWADQSKQLQDKFATRMREGMLKGEGIDKLTQRVRGTKAAAYTDGIMQASKAQAEALVRTSVISTANEARIATILGQSDLAKGIQWVATLDSRTSDICRALDGRQWTIPDLKPVGHDKAFPGPTAHWNCRSTQIPVLRSWAELAGPNNKLKNTEGIEGNYQEILKAKLEAAGMDEAAAQTVVGNQKAKLNGKGIGNDTKTFEDWLSEKTDPEIDALLGPGRGALWRDGKITIAQLTDQNNRPLSLGELQQMVLKNETTAPPKEGENGLSLQERHRLEESMAHGVKFQKVLTHWVDADTGETLSLEGTGAMADQLAKLQSIKKLHVLQNSLGTGEVWTPQQLQLFGALQGFKKATMVGPTGRTIAISVKPGQVFDQPAAAKVWSEFQALKNVKTIPQTQQKFGSAVSKEGSLKFTLGKAEAVQLPPATFNEKFPELLQKPAPFFNAAKEADTQAAAVAAKKEAELLSQQAVAAKAIADKADLEAAARSLEVQANADALQARQAAAKSLKALEAAEAEQVKAAAAWAKQNADAQSEIADVLANPTGKTLLAKELAKAMKANPGNAPADLLNEAKEAAVLAQQKASQSAALSGYKKKMLAGEQPTPAQKKALAKLTEAEQNAFHTAIADAMEAQLQKAAKDAADAAAKQAAEQNAAAAAVAASKPVGPMPAATVGLPEPVGFPADPNNLKVVRTLGGTTGAELVQDPDGNLFVRKRGANPGHVREEVLADALYRQFGADVPEAKLYDTATGPVKLARFVEGKTLAAYMQSATAAEKAAVKAELQKAFAVDALLGNWDVIGTSRDNVIVGKDGRVWRIDNGGSMRYRAQGAQKLPEQWHQFADEVWTMRGIYNTPRLAAIQADIAASFQRDFAEFFGSLSVYDIARQVDAMDASRLAIAPDDIRRVLELRMAHLKAISATNLDFEHARWNAGVADNMARNQMELRQKGVVARMVPHLTLQPGTPTMKDADGNDFDELRSKRAAGAVAANASDPFAAPFLAAVISVNAHHNKQTGNFANPVTIGEALKHEAVLTAWQKSGTPAQKALAAHYLPWIDKIKGAQQDWNAGIKAPLGTNPLPPFDAGAGAVAVAGVTNAAAVIKPKPNSSIGQDVAAYITTLGGNANAVSSWMGSQAGSSWSSSAIAMKYFVATSSDKPPTDWWWGVIGNIAGAKKHFDALAATVGGEEKLRKTFTAWIAYTQEVLNTTRLPNKDDTLRVVRLIRTEEESVLKSQGIPLGSYGGVHTVKKGSNESHSTVAITTITGQEVTVTAVPFANVTGLYITERPSASGLGSGGAAFLGDHENEYTANTSGLPFVYAGKSSGRTLSKGPAFWKTTLQAWNDAGPDASKWGVPLDHIRKKP